MRRKRGNNNCGDDKSFSAREAKFFERYIHTAHIFYHSKILTVNEGDKREIGRL